MRLLTGRRRYIEVGTYDKGCLAYVAGLLAPDAVLIDVDIESRPEQTQKLTETIRPTQRLATIVGDSVAPATLEQVAGALDGQKADAIFIDGNHAAAYAWADYSNFLAFLEPGGILLFHDVFWLGNKDAPGVSQAMEWIDRVHPVHAVYCDDPVHRYFPMFDWTREYWGVVGILQV
jgi:predicted O-methyltransferase YrrM